MCDSCQGNPSTHECAARVERLILCDARGGPFHNGGASAVRGRWLENISPPSLGVPNVSSPGAPLSHVPCSSQTLATSLRIICDCYSRQGHYARKCNSSTAAALSQPRTLPLRCPFLSPMLKLSSRPTPRPRALLVGDHFYPPSSKQAIGRTDRPRRDTARRDHAV